MPDRDLTPSAQQCHCAHAWLEKLRLKSRIGGEGGLSCKHASRELLESIHRPLASQALGKVDMSVAKRFKDS